MHANDSRGQESPARPTRTDDTYVDDRLEAPWSRRSDCTDCGASNPADAPCCWRCGGTLEVDADEELVTDGGTTTDGGSLYPDVNPHTGGNAWLIRQIAVDLSLVTYWNGDCPDALTNRHRRLGIGHTVGEGPSAVSRFQKGDLVAIASHLTNRPKCGFYDQTTSELRALIGEEVGIEYDPDRSTTPFRKDEPGAILMECARIDFRQDGGPA